MIRAVFFDVGGTLLQPWPSVGAVYAEVGSRHGFIATAVDMERAFRGAWQQAKTNGVGTDGLTVSNREWWQQLVFSALDALGLEDNTAGRAAYFEELYEVFAQPRVWRIFPDVEPVLRGVRARGLHVGVISNWDARLRPLLDALGLSARLDSVTVSCELRCEKPRAEIFRAALQAANITAREALHVGDALEEDVRGAEAIGMGAVLIDRAGCAAGNTNTVQSLEQIYHIIDEAGEQPSAALR